ncbi:uncharacterized protein MELLADRAFT_67737 [Melampsora larici-populina 98AG31]|uniref:Secreted protein n=1 Tax=Melampsora larici-populina (strain 98AG31 / pathotype 3-4-7) TaxID=747676 RepID=F4S437_MELLP|nr:uncharacterized protein MELLADRAFT_67737 [Melampsora larici-populina 98AG31]EGG00575.1 hypothetical protein MELLADRAFT_67737 [Melampsora larici-populina 98AG31]
MTAPTRRVILSFSTQILVQICYLSCSASAAIHLTESSGLLNKPYHDSWYKHSGTIEPNARDNLEVYLDKTLEERKNSEPFVTSSAALNDDSVKLINKMLQSGSETWAKTLEEIMKNKPSYKIEDFWKFISQLSDFMPTSALQVTLFEVVKAEEKVFKQKGDKFLSPIRNVLNEVFDRCAAKMKEHVGALKQKDKTQEVQDIFTRTGQEKMGEYGIRLEGQYSVDQEAVLYRNWASCPLKRILEIQAIQVSSIDMEEISTMGITVMPDDIRPHFENWMGSDVQGLKEEFVDYIKSLDNSGLEHFKALQSQLSYGLSSVSPRNPKDIKKVFVFWANYMPFYLQIKTSKDTWDYLYVMENLILDEIEDKDLDLLMKEFIMIQTSPIIQQNIIISFLEFLVDKSKSLKRIAEFDLSSIRDIEEAKQTRHNNPRALK